MEPRINVFQKGKTNVITRQDEEPIVWWPLRINPDSGLRNFAETKEIGNLSWFIGVAGDVTPRDVLECLGIDPQAVGLYDEKENTSWESRDGHGTIFVFPSGPAMAMDAPLIPTNYADVHGGHELRLRVLGDLVLLEEDDGAYSSSSSNEREPVIHIYVLKCSQGKYYVGKTGNPYFRLQDHFDLKGSGAAWTRKYPPQSVDLLLAVDSALEENNYTLKYMEQYGIENVRGGPWVQLKLPDAHIKSIQHQLGSAQDLCHSCHQPGHFQRNCPRRNQQQSVSNTRQRNRDRSSRNN